MDNCYSADQLLWNPVVCFLLFFCSFWFVMLLQISPVITEVENNPGDPGLFSAMFLPKYHSLRGFACFAVHMLLPFFSAEKVFVHTVPLKVLGLVNSLSTRDANS